jgi:hypothetical protein
MLVEDHPAWILDAKSPNENVLDPNHEAQAYSYACHRDVDGSQDPWGFDG